MRALLAGVVVAGCGFAPQRDAHLLDAGSGSSAAPVDAPIAPDAGQCAALGAQCADDATLRTCTTLGAPPVDTTCAWGCAGAAAHCSTLVPSGGAAVPEDLGIASELASLALHGTVDGASGAISGGLRAPTASGQIDHGIYFYLRGGIAVFRVASLRVDGNVTLAGPNPVVFVATTTITVDASISAQGDCNSDHAGPGGGAGGVAGQAGTGTGGGLANTSAVYGGGGGGNGAPGGAGGVGNNTTAQGGGVAFGDPGISHLVGGSGGGGGGGGGRGGGGGGAIQLVAGGTLTIGPQGVINAGGCGGTNGGNHESGGGGGAGGTILLEAHDIAIGGRLAVNGGGGASAGGGNDGSDGTPDRTRAPGGGNGDASGGAGGAGATAGGLAGAGNAGVGGGGGGGTGRMRFNTRSGAVDTTGATLSPALADPATTTTAGAAAVQ